MLKQKEAKAVLDDEQAKQSEIEAIGKVIAAIEAELPDYMDLDTQRDELKETSETIETQTKAVATKREFLSKLADTLAALKAEQKSLETAVEEKAKLEAAQKDDKQEKAVLDALQQDISELDMIKNELEAAQEDYVEKFELAERKRFAYESKHKTYLHEQAGILADMLVDDEPCPVCGSLQHPSVACKSEDAPTQVELDTLKKSVDKAENESAKASVEAGRIKGVFEEKRSAVEKSAKVYFPCSVLEDISVLLTAKIVDIQTKLSELSDLILEAERKVNRKKQLDMLIPEKQESERMLTDEISKTKAMLAAENAKKLSLEKRISELMAKLKYENKSSAKIEIERLDTQQKMLKKAFEKAQHSFDQCKDTVTGLRAKIEEAKQLLKDKPEIDIDAEIEKRQILTQKKKSVTEKKQEVITRISSNRTTLIHIVDKSADAVSIEKRWTWVKSLSNTANGNIGGKEKIMLETYIQMTYFDRIISRANSRFMIMSGGQYELKRRKEAGNNRSQSGLELDVTDHYNGTERSVKTLSGGESFKASLSLALGLSDEIQSSAGGIRLDTMFVDEGFGSLDEESLRQAMRALSDLSEGNRLVGIISHVTELKEKIDKQVIVTKDVTGEVLRKLWYNDKNKIDISKGQPEGLSFCV